MIECDDDDAALVALENTRFTTFWLDSLPPEQCEPSLTQNTETDLLIVGGGFCGLWGAILAKEKKADRDVVLIEAKEIANGASGRPGAILSTSVMHGIDNTERMFPDDVEALEEFGRENLDAFRETLKRYNIDCDLEWGGELKVSIGDGGLNAVAEDHKLYEKYGHDSYLLDKQAVQQEIHSPLFHGGVWSTRRSGTVNPGKLVRGLKQIALQLGVRIFENTPHLSNKNMSDNIVVQTPNAIIFAQKILLATNAWAAGHKHIKRRVVAVRDRIVVTDPLNDEQLKLVGWQNRQGVYDTRTQLNYMRLTRDNRILFGGRLGYFYGNDTEPKFDKTAAPYLRLVNAFYRTFPQLKEGVRFSHAWSGPIGLTTRMAVHYQRYHNGKMIFAGGYSGFGVTASRFGAKVGLAILDGEDSPESRLAFANSVPGYVPSEPFRWAGAKITLYALDTLDEKGGWRKLWIWLVEKMGFPLTL
ncbi:MAG: glycine/D-amino acid oxidase-like deaminating enzyme [bacterium]|jgi:glycine/D-amino acid oxidase-like deaminating enzyme